MSSQNRQMKNNYHTHTHFCNHAEGTVKDYVKKAIELGFDTIGMSDHAPMEAFADHHLRMTSDQFPLYLSECDQAIKLYHQHIKILKGLEIEYLPGHTSHYRRLLLDLDYLALGQHYVIDEEAQNNLRSVYHLSSLDHMRSYTELLIEAMQTGWFAFVCHPDVMLINVHEITEPIRKMIDRIIDASVQYDVPLEINANGIRKGSIDVHGEKRYRYPRKEFWERVKEKHARVIISSDAHQPSLLYDKDVERAYAFAEDLGIEVEEELHFDEK